MYCRCRKRADGYTAARNDDGTFNYDFWVCAACNKPSQPVFEKLTAMRVPSKATALLSSIGDGEGRSILTWATSVTGERIQTMTFHPYPRKVDMPVHTQGRDALVTFWKSLDDCVDRIRSGSSIEPEYEKIRATTYAEVLAHLMSPFYEDRDAVLRESMARWTARQEGREHVSPGLAEAVWDPATRFDGTPYAEENERRVRASNGKPVPVQLDEQKRNFIKTMLSNGSMDVATLAGMFDVSPEVIEANYDV